MCTEVDVSKWKEWRDEMWDRLRRDFDVGYIDEDIVDVLELIFSREHSFTISSCSGRVTVLDGPMPWDRKESTIIFKKHKSVTTQEILNVIKQPTLYCLWLIVSGPIIHVVSDSIEEALNILRIAREAGMKHSGILSISDKGIISELKTGIRVNVLLKIRNYVVIDLKEIDKVVKVINDALLEGKRRLMRLKEALEKDMKFRTGRQ